MVDFPNRECSTVNEPIDYELMDDDYVRIKFGVIPRWDMNQNLHGVYIFIEQRPDRSDKAFFYKCDRKDVQGFRVNSWTHRRGHPRSGRVEYCDHHDAIEHYWYPPDDTNQLEFDENSVLELRFVDSEHG